ncbi:MAG: hypothetical protein Q7T19_12720 [Caulobacter sp.]|nr:hypothetical protein [Caulobacter sp.]
MPRVLTITGFADVHALAIERAIRLQGGESTIWNISDFPRHQRISSLVDDAGESHVNVLQRDHSVITGPFDVVWNRRALSKNLYSEGLHEGDMDFVRHETTLFLRSLYLSSFRDAFWLNAPLNKFQADAKLAQILAAKACGLYVPPTLVSNDPEQVLAFVERYGWNVIVKSFHGHAWNVGGGPEEQLYVNYAARVKAEALTPEAIAACPAIYQRLVEKAFELRIVLCGESLMAIKIDSQIRQDTAIDFRSGQGTLPLSEYALPDDVQAKLIQFAKALGIVFGSIDAIITPNNEFVFLEVNEQGQFLWCELNNPDIPVTQFVTDFLMYGRADFRWERPERPMRLAEIEDAEFKHNFSHLMSQNEYAELNNKNGYG